MTGVTWLHLSDWHQENKKFKFNRKVVCDGLIKDIKAREQGISPRLKKIDFIVFSGDVAKGGDPDEYEKAIDEFFKPILDACKLGPERLFIVPGNHDLNRDQIPVSLSKPLTSNEEVERCWSEKRKTALLPFQDFFHSFSDLTGREPGERCDLGPIEVDGKKISLLCINSAWMCARHKDEEGEVSDQGYLCVGEPQIYESLEKISGSDIRIALLHHPFDWLAPFDKSRMDVHLKRKCNFILHGHAHEPGVSAIRDNFGYHITIPAGACYDRSLPSSSDYNYSYNYVHLDFDSDKGIVFFRKWSELNRNWRKDDETAPPNGERDFSISGSTKAPIPRQIPPPPRDFKGREQDIRDILSSFERGAAITGFRGMGGVGKTALALVLAEKIKDKFPDGQIFIDMRGTSTNPNLPALKPEEAMAHVIRAYNPADRPPENINELRGLYHSILSGKHTLLLLDNASDATQVEPLLPPTGCSLIITSRLKFTIPGLAEKDLDVMPAEEARQLLLSIAPRIGERANELAKLCGYLPLALRNAARALSEKKDLKITEYEQRLKDKVARLELVKGSFSLSYDLLSPARRKQWSRLSVFPEDFDRNAAAAVLKMAPGPSAETLSDLVRWSLVDYIPTACSEDGRYKLHDLSRLFAESCLEECEIAYAKQRHSNYYTKILSQAGNLYEKGGEGILEGLKLFDLEWINMKMGHAWVKNAIQSYRMFNIKDQKIIMKLARSYTTNGIYVLNLRLNPQDRIAWIEIGLTAARITNDRRSEGSHLGNLGSAYRDMGDAKKAIEYQDQALAIAREIADKRMEASNLCSLGVIYDHLGETRKAIEYLDQGLAISIDICDKRGEGSALGNLANAYADLGEINRAVEYYYRALTIFKNIGDQKGEGACMGNLGIRYFDLGETRKAIQYYDQALAIAREIGDRRSEGTNLNNLGLAYADLGQTGKAIEYHEYSLDIAREIGDRKGEEARLNNLGLEYANIGEIDKALQYYERALTIAREIGDKENEGEILCNFGKVYLDLNEINKAVSYCTLSLNIASEIEYRKYKAESLCTLGKAFACQDEPQKALEHCDQALNIFQEIKYPKGEAEALFARSQALYQLGRHEEATHCAQQGFAIFQRIESPLAEKVRQQLAEWGGTLET